MGKNETETSREIETLKKQIITKEKELEAQKAILNNTHKYFELEYDPCLVMNGTEHVKILSNKNNEVIALRVSTESINVHAMRCDLSYFTSLPFEGITETEFKATLKTVIDELKSIYSEV